VTYCIGFKYKDSVYLIGDAAITNATPAYQTSTSGELHTDVQGSHVEEAVIKVTSIAPGAIVAFAGDVGLAIDIIDFLRASYSESTTPAELFNGVNATFGGPFRAGVEILFATAPAIGPTTLTKWTTDKGIEREVTEYREIGGLPYHLRRLTFESFKLIVDQQTDAAAILSVVTAKLQSLGVHDNLIEQRVGGIFFGMRAVAGTTMWQWDTVYLIYDSAFKSLIFLMAMAHGDILTVWSSLFGGARFLMLPSNTRTEQEFWSNVPRTIDFTLWSHCTCLRTNDRRVTSIFRPDPRSFPSRFIKFSTKETPDGIIVGIEPVPELLADLLLPIESATPNDPRTIEAALRFIIDHPSAPDIVIERDLPPQFMEILSRANRSS
jgi:hypothetical protein